MAESSLPLYKGRGMVPWDSSMVKQVGPVTCLALAPPDSEMQSLAKNTYRY